MKAKSGKISRRTADATGRTLQRLTRTPETASLIFEFAESLYLRDETAQRMNLSDIEQIGEFLKQTENDLKRMKIQFQDLAEIESSFQSNEIPIGF